MSEQTSNIGYEKKAPRFDNNVNAIISAFLGALSILFLLIIVYVGMIIGFISIIFGIIALVQMRTTEQVGKGMAKLGIISGSITIALPLLVIVYAITSL
ncbi:DUF4190 domain-containing protein [Salipaludibacillus daqingensis]|uniref:DUF4190 domain-containing protein n=1 Tax=Salipaludibacillus daqingensis TaxID=3041001 RepID=UPI0024740260|nr:DUF4190 domain-containing protein [Salipaludibacillus daqingensis]